MNEAFPPPRLFGVGGLHSGVGKTALICRLLRALPGWGALKTSPLETRARPFDLLRDPSVLGEPGRDTGRYLEAGAARVLWLRYTARGLAEGLEAAWAAFGPATPGILVEGNGWVEAARPERFILVADATRREIKPSARRVAPRADLVVLNRRRTDPADAVLRAARDVGRTLGAEPWIADVTDPREPGCAALLERVATWARQRR